MKWQAKLTKAELKHLRQQLGRTPTLTAATMMFKKQAEMRQESEERGMPPGVAEPCWECWTIARKLRVRK